MLKIKKDPLLILYTHSFFTFCTINLDLHIQNHSFWETNLRIFKHYFEAKITINKD